MAPAFVQASIFALQNEANETSDGSSDMISSLLPTGYDKIDNDGLLNYSSTSTIKSVLASATMRQVYNVKKFSQPTAYNSTRTHEEQVQAFFFTVVIIMFYALTILYFMLKQICRQEKEHKKILYNYVMGREYELHQRERVMRATMKKQLCMHLIKMGQFTQSLVSMGRRPSVTGPCSSGERRYECNGHICTKDQSTEIDDDLFLVDFEETEMNKLVSEQVLEKSVRFSTD